MLSIFTNSLSEAIIQDSSKKERSNNSFMYVSVPLIWKFIFDNSIYL